MLIRNGPVNRECAESVVWRWKRVCGGKDLWNRLALTLSREWKSYGVMDEKGGESSEEAATSAGKGESETEKLIWETGNWFQRQGEAYRKERSVIRNEDDEGRRTGVTKDEQRVLPGGCTVREVMQIWMLGGCKYLRKCQEFVFDRYWVSEESEGWQWYEYDRMTGFGALTTARAREFWIC